MKNKILKIKLLNIADDIKRNWWILFLSVLLGLMAAYLYESDSLSEASRDEVSVTLRAYETNAQIYNIWSATSAAKEVTGNLKSVLENEAVWTSLVKDFDYDSLPKVTINRMENSGLITLVVRSKSPVLAYNVISSLINAYPGIARYFNSSSAIEVLHSPEPAATRFSGGISFVLFPLLFLFLTFLMIVFLSASINTVKKLSDIDEILPSFSGFKVKIDKLTSSVLKDGDCVWLNAVKHAVHNEISSGVKTFLVSSTEKSVMKSAVVFRLADELNKSGVKTAVVSENREPFGKYGMKFTEITSANVGEKTSSVGALFLDSSGMEEEILEQTVLSLSEIVDCILWDYPDLKKRPAYELFPGVEASVLFVIDSMTSSS